MKKVIQLIRVSTDRQAASDRASIPAQRAVNQRTCGQNGLEIVRSIELADVSGACVLLTPEIQELIQLMRSPDVHGVVAREFSRLMRPENFEDFALLQVFVDTKTILYLPEGPIDLSNKNGRLMGTIRAAIAGMERTEILERIWTAKEEKRRRGELAQNKIVLPWGVGYEAGRFFYKPEAEKMREVFRQFLAGNQSYMQLAKLLGVTSRGMHLIMRNPIWIGWRVIDKKRDISAAGRYPSINGRQADRRKIARPPDEVIRVRVIEEGLVSDDDFRAIQKIMDLKQAKHWRSQPNLEHRFTYNGFLTCSDCGEQIHTALARRDYYACKGRRTIHSCTTKYMARERLERTLDSLFADYLTSESFLQTCAAEMENRFVRSESVVRTQRLTASVAMLREKRGRVVDAFLEGVIGRDERDRRLAGIDRELTETQGLLLRETAPAISVEGLMKAFAVLVEWRLWNREQKRAVLAALVPDIRVANYQVSEIGMNFSNEDTRRDRDSLRPRA
jgi:DNA invertase Pin-like site-specific DNA recombinase